MLRTLGLECEQVTMQNFYGGGLKLVTLIPNIQMPIQNRLSKGKNGFPITRAEILKNGLEITSTLSTGKITVNKSKMRLGQLIHIWVMTWDGRSAMKSIIFMKGLPGLVSLVEFLMQDTIPTVSFSIQELTDYLHQLEKHSSQS